MRRTGSCLCGAVQFEYDPRGRLAAVVDPDGLRVDYVYDHFNRLTHVLGAEGDPQTDVASIYQWYPDGTLESVDNSFNERTDYHYDQLGRLSVVYHPNGASSQVTYSGFGDIRSITHREPGPIETAPIIEQFTVEFRGIVCPPNPLKFVPHILKSNLQW